MGMTEGVHTDAGEEIEVAAAVYVIQIAASPARDNERVPGIVLKNGFFFQVDDRLGTALYNRWRGARHFFIIAWDTVLCSPQELHSPTTRARPRNRRSAPHYSLT
jgi:hypothetical protein